MKKGFTLIEMLGILIILSVIILVSLPSIIQTNRNTKQSEIDENKKTIFMAAETYIELDKDASANLKKNKYYYVKLTTLVTEGLLSSNLKNPGNNLEKTIVEDVWWVEARMNNGSVNYSLVNENPYEAEIKEGQMVYSVILEKNEVIRDKMGASVNRYIYTNSNPNNYVKFNNEIWRIVALEEDKTIKLVRDEFLTKSDGSTNIRIGTSNTISTSTELISYLNSTYLNSMSPSAQRMIVSHKFNTGTFNLSGLTSSSKLVGSGGIEVASSITTKVGLLNPSDYIQASANSECNIGTSYTHSTTEDPCLMNNYLYKGARWWMMHPATSGNVVMNEGDNTDLNAACSQATATQKNKDGINSFPSTCLAKVRPVIYLSKDITIASGSGSNTDPYVFSKMS